MAAAGPQIQRRALIIGNSKYEQSAPLTFCEHDAKDMARTLKQHEFDVISEINLTRTEMQPIVDKFAQKSNPNSLMLFYFSGLAIELTGQAYLVPIEARRSTVNGIDSEHDTISVMSITDLIIKGKPYAAIFIFDCGSFNANISMRELMESCSQSNETNVRTLFVLDPCKTTSNESSPNCNSRFTSRLLQAINEHTSDYDAMIDQICTDLKNVQEDQLHVCRWPLTSPSKIYLNPNLDCTSDGSQSNDDPTAVKSCVF